MTGTLLAAIIVIGCLIAPALTDPTAQNLEKTLQPFSLEPPLGTDHLGRDLLSRTLHAGRTSLAAVAVVIGSSLGIGTLIGLIAGLRGGWLDTLFMRLADVILALPGLILATAVVGALGPGLHNLLPVLVISWWPGYARLVRSQVLGLRRAEFVTAAHALGGSEAHIARAHVLPALLGPVAVQASLDAGHVLLSIAALSFLGLGVQPPTPEWGAMLTEARAYMQTAPHLVIAPGLAVLGTVFGLNALAEWLEHRLNPRRAEHG